MKRRSNCPVRLVPLAALAVLSLAAGARAQSHEAMCEYELGICEAGATHTYNQCVRRPEPPRQCEGNYTRDMDACSARFHACMDAGPPPDDDPYDDQDSQPPTSPIILDLDGNGIHLTDAAGGVPWHFHPALPLYQVGWPVDGGDAWLALDRNGDGVIDSGRELFGNATALASGRIARHGYEALRELDANGDRWIDAADPAFGALRLWRDHDHNGLSEAAELVPLAQAGVASLSVEPHESRRRDRWGNAFRYRALVRFSGPPYYKLSWDVFLVYREPGGGN